MNATTSASHGEIFLYESEEGKMALQVQLQNDTVWLTQAQIAELFGKGRSTVTEHIRNVFKENELNKNSVCRDFRHTASDGKGYVTTYYNLDVIISVGYRVKSKQGTQFRIWANRILKDYLIKGFATQEKLKLSQRKQRICSILSSKTTHSRMVTSGSLH